MKSGFRFHVIALACLLTAGCRGGNGSVTAEDNKAFDSAAPEAKQTWQVALEAGRTNDFEGSKKLFYSLITPETTPAQQQAVKHALAALDQKFSEALSKGDPAAQQALEAMQKNAPNRGGR
jgi:hypothetical protein